MADVQLSVSLSLQGLIRDAREAEAILRKQIKDLEVKVNVEDKELSVLDKTLNMLRDKADRFADGLFQGMGQQAFSAVTGALSGMVGNFQNVANESINMAQRFNAAKAAANSLGADGEAVGEAMRELSGELAGLSNTVDLTEASYDVLSARTATLVGNLSDAEVVTEIMGAAVKGAAAGFSDVATVSDALTSTLNSYKMTAAESESVTAKFLATQNAGKITVAQYAAQIGRVASTAANAGVSLDELNGFIATATVSGVPVESTFAGIRQAIAAAMNPEFAKKAQALGLSMEEADIKTAGLSGIMAALNKNGLDTSENLLKLFGSVEALAAIAPSAGEGFKALETNIAASANALESGVLQSGLEAVTGSVEARLQNSANQISEGFLKLGEGLLPVKAAFNELFAGVLGSAIESTDAFDVISDAGNRLAEALRENPDLIREIGEALGGMATAVAEMVAAVADNAIPAAMGMAEILPLLANSIKLVAENSEILLKVATVLALRFTALKGIQLASSLHATAIGSITAAGGLTKMAIASKAAVMSLGPLALQLVAIAAAIEGIKFAKFALDMANSNEKLEQFAVEVKASGDAAIKAAERTKGVNAKIAAGNASADDLLAAKKLTEANKERLSYLEDQLKIAEQLPAATEEQRNAREALMKDTQLSIRALTGQNAELEKQLANVGKTPEPAATTEATPTEEKAAEEESTEEKLKALKAAYDKEMALIEGQAASEDQIRQQKLEKERAYLDERTKLNEARIAELQAIAASGEGEEAAKAQAEILQIEQENADAKVAIRKNEIAQKEAAEDAALAKRKLQADAELATLDKRSNSLAQDAALMDAQVALQQSLATLEEQRLQAAIAQAQERNDTVAAAELQQQLDQKQTANLAAQFAAKQQQLEISQAQTAIDLERESITARIAKFEAEAELAKARARGASADEIRNLEQQVRLRDQQVSFADAAKAQQSELNDLANQQLSVEQQIAEEALRRQQVENQTKLAKEQQLKLLDAQAAREKLLAEQKKAALDAQNAALQRQSQLLQAQQSVSTAAFALEQQRLGNKLKDAKTAGERRQAEDALFASQRAQFESEIAAKTAQLAIAQRQQEIDLQNQELSAQRAINEAQIALLKAQASGATAEELALLQQQVQLSQQQLGQIGAQRATNQALNAQQQQALAIEAQTGREGLLRSQAGQTTRGSERRRLTQQAQQMEAGGVMGLPTVGLPPLPIAQQLQQPAPFSPALQGQTPVQAAAGNPVGQPKTGDAVTSDRAVTVLQQIASLLAEARLGSFEINLEGAGTDQLKGVILETVEELRRR